MATHNVCWIQSNGRLIEWFDWKVCPKSKQTKAKEKQEMEVSYLSGAYVGGLLILVAGVVLPMVYMVLQNRKAFKTLRRD